MAIDTTMVCALHRDGTPRRGADTHDGVALRAARRRKERTYPELLWTSSTGAACGCCSRSRRTLVRRDQGVCERIGHRRARHELPLMRKRAEQAWRMRWGGMLACTAARAVASSLLDLQHCHGGDGNTPFAHEVDGDHRYAGLAPG